MPEIDRPKSTSKRKGLTPNKVRAVDRDLLWAAEEYGILGAIGDQGVEIDQLRVDPSEPEVYQRAKMAVVRNLVARRFVREKDGKLEISPRYPELLPGATFRRYILDLRSWYEVAYIAPASLRQGKPPEIARRAYDGIVEISRSLAEKLVQPVQRDFPAITTEPMEALDLACGKLHVLRTIARENPNLKVTGIEQNPKFLNFLGETLPQEGLAERVSIVAGDLREGTKKLLDNQFRFIFASHIIHWLTPDETAAMFKEARRLLQVGGAFFVNEDRLSDSGLTPIDSVGKHTRMTAQGFQVYTTKQTVEMLCAAGFKNPQQKSIDSRRILFECFE